jgi:putative acetyltransferase
VAPALLQALLGRAESAGLPRVFVEASELARGLFERHGFRLVARRDFEVRGVPIHNYAMERRLG